MKIYSMTATFGKLEHETLTLKPGLNIISAPNEWGKSTWCAFLAAMLYGLETRAKSTKTTLADKERFAPWSGAPMAGRMDLNWNGRDITIERSTRRRVPLGEFRAYETETGIPVEELTASNCGEMLLGVEQSVFRRAGFIRFSELPVTQDEALRRRLNALVTTGDESGAADALADSLKDLKNRCRYNRSGLLPQAEQERDQIRETIAELDELETQSEKIDQRLKEIKQELALLDNHRQTLLYAQTETASLQSRQAKHQLDEAEQALRDLEGACALLPDRGRAEESLKELRLLREQWNALQMEVQALPQLPEEPRQEGPFAGMDAHGARVMAQMDAKLYASLTTSKVPLLLLIMGALGLISAVTLLILKVFLFGTIAGAVSLIALVWGLYEGQSQKKKAAALAAKYGTADVTYWSDPIRLYEDRLRRYEELMVSYGQRRIDLDKRLAILRRRRETLCGDREPDMMADYWQGVLNQWDAREAARREAARAQSHFETISAMVRTVEKPKMEDDLTLSEAETAREIGALSAEQQRLQNRLGQLEGRMATLGRKAGLEQELEKKERRIRKLEETYTALTIAQETLAEARTELQRRFAPRITKRAQSLLSAMTGGRYHSLTMGVDFNLQAGAGQEDTLHDALWRSDGTVDQLYLALRLAVAEELTPEAPLVLDDALVRFDDERMAAAVKILGEVAQSKQVICFTCQGREKELA